MAKSKSFFGLRRGSTKSLTFQVLDGKQITKDRVSEVKNPRTQGQLYQRAIMATVMQAYSAGKAIFDHSFQGLAVGAKNQREFMSTNAKILRNLVAEEINGNITLPQARVVAPKSLYPVPFGGMMISRGSYEQKLFTLTDPTNLTTQTIVSLPATASAEETVAEYAARVGLIADDIYTFVIFSVSSLNPIFEVAGVNYETAKQYPVSFNFIRMRVKNLSAVTTPMDKATIGDVFTVDATNINISSFVTNNAIGELTITDIMPTAVQNYGAFGIIRSREDQDLRSTSYLHLAGDGNGFGLAAEYLLPAWKQGTANAGSSELILEGGNF